MMPVTHCRLCHLRQQSLGITEQETLHRTCAIELVFQKVTLQPIGMASTLHNSPARRGFSPHKQGDADDSFVSDHGDFGRRAIFHDAQKGYDRVGREIDMTHLRVWLVNHVTKHQRYQFQMRRETVLFFLRQGGKEVVLANMMKWTHERLPISFACDELSGAFRERRCRKPVLLTLSKILLAPTTQKSAELSFST